MQAAVLNDVERNAVSKLKCPSWELIYEYSKRNDAIVQTFFNIRSQVAVLINLQDSIGNVVSRLEDGARQHVNCLQLERFHAVDGSDSRMAAAKAWNGTRSRQHADHSDMELGRQSTRALYLKSSKQTGERIWISASFPDERAVFVIEVTIATRGSLNLEKQAPANDML